LQEWTEPSLDLSTVASTSLISYTSPVAIDPSLLSMDSPQVAGADPCLLAEVVQTLAGDADTTMNRPLLSMDSPQVAGADPCLLAEVVQTLAGDADTTVALAAASAVQRLAMASPAGLALVLSDQPRCVLECIIALVRVYLLSLLNILMPAQLNCFTHLRAQLVLHGRGGGPISLIGPGGGAI
jgi:hypothetical protein